MKSPYWLGILCLFLSMQTSVAQTDAPQSPTVASLMRFEEYPVDHYTGIPRVSIPIYSMPTRSNDISVDVVLNYHPSSVASFNEKSGDCGRGWNLANDGGAIYKMVMGGYIDEEAWRLGHLPNHSDIYQFSFRGFSGKFTVHKSGSTFYTNVYENDGTPVKIDVVYNTTTKKLESFTAYDDKGYKYVFGTSDTFAYKEAEIVASSRAYSSAYHLTHIYDPSNNLLVQYNYNNFLDYCAYHVDTFPIEANEVKVLNEIVVPGYGKLDFSYTLDQDMADPDNYHFDEVVVYNFANSPITKFAFEFDLDNNLQSVDEVNSNDDLIQSHKLFYRDYGLIPFHFELGTDAWGYKNYTYDWCNRPDVKELAGDYADVGVLEKMILPSGGSIVYDYEVNTFSFNKDKPLDDGVINPDFFSTLEEPRNFHNYTQDMLGYFSLSTQSASESETTFTLSQATTVYFAINGEQYEINPVSGYPPYQYPTFTLTKTGSSYTNIFHESGGNYGSVENYCLGKMLLLETGTYKLKITAPNAVVGAVGTGTVTILAYDPDTTIKKWWQGGGIRIKTIGYFTESDVPQDYYDDPEANFDPAKEIKYDYTLFDDPSMSSGVLLADGVPEDDVPGQKYETIAYRNVNVSETGAGRTDYSYYTLLDFEDLDDEVYEVMSPIIGKLKQVKVYDEAGTLLKENNFEYFFNDVQEISEIGNQTFSLGWVRLIEKDSKAFLPSGTVETTENFTYYTNRKLYTHTRTNSTMGETLKIEYEYDTNNSIHTQNRIEPKITRQFRNSTLLSRSDIEYYNSWGGNVSYLPQIIKSAKGTTTPEARMNITRYDQYGHVLEFKPENGVETVYVWGYNDTQIIAKIEGLPYSSVNSSHMNNARTVSNGTSESSLLTALNTLRSSVNTAGGMITTYTHKPLVGISTITDPRGNKVTYEYDEDNRLEAVKDKDGNILSETEYHIKPLNP